MDSGTSEFSPNASTTCSASLCLQEPVVDEDARQVVADRPVDEHRRRRGVDPAGEPADGPRVTYLLPYPLDRVVDDVDRRPLRLAAAGLVEEVLEDLHPVLRVPTSGWN